MTDRIIPEALYNTLRAGATSRNRSKLQNYLDIRDYLEENRDYLMQSGLMMQTYQEFADALLCSESTVRKNLSIIRNYPADRLQNWLDAGLSFDHIETANASYQEWNDKPPADILDEAVVYGGDTIGNTMTVDELQQFARLNKDKWTPLMYAKNYLNKIVDMMFVKKWSDAEKIQLAYHTEEIQKLFKQKEG